MKLETYLAQSQITQAEFATRIGRAPSYVSQVLRGTIWPSRSVMVSIASATGGAVTANDFLPQEESAA